jgi:hypothetical protein
MSKILSTILEKAPPRLSNNAEQLSSFITSNIDVEEMRGKRGADFGSTQFYQIRVKPREKLTDLNSILLDIERLLKTEQAKKLGISEVQINQRSRNSGKYSSVSFHQQDGIDYDIVVAHGANRGEAFEKNLLLKMDNLVAGIDSTEEALAAFAALEKIDPVFKLENIAGVSARHGSVQRSGDLSPEETGKIIADIVVELKNGDKKYISVKNKEGSTVAQFGISKAFSDDLKVNTGSQEWKNWIEPFGLDAAKIEEGLLAAQEGTDLDWSDIDKTEVHLNKNSAVHKIMQKLWGANYYYLRESNHGFKALKIDTDFVSNTLLSNLKVTEVRYPSRARKQITIYLESDSMKFKIEIRNPRGKGSARPTQIQLVIMKSYM